MYTILVCDDDVDIASALKIYLTAEGYNVLVAHDGEAALKIIASERVHLVIMDIMMPKLDGIAATARLREADGVAGGIPIILLTAKSEDTDIVLGLNIGAEDYVTKPYNPVELMARVKAQLRRYTKLGGATDIKDKPGVYQHGGILLDDNAKTVTLDGEQVSLTPTEFALLKVLIREPGHVFSSKQLYEAVRGESPFGAEGMIAVHIRHLREKLEIDPSNPRHIKVVWGQGYKLE